MPLFRPSRTRRCHSLERLEARIAPAGVVYTNGGKTAKFTDLDGDAVTVTITKGALSDANFSFVQNATGQQIAKLDLSYASFNNGTVGNYAGSGVSVTAVRTAAGGDSFVNVGYIHATGIDLGAVKVGGDLGQIDAGDATGTTGVASLTAQSMGVFGLTTQKNGAGSNLSTIIGGLGTLAIKTDLSRATLSVEHSAGAPDTGGGIGTATIGGNLVGYLAADGANYSDPGSLQVAGDVGALTIGGSVLGGSVAGSGYVSVSGKITTLRVGGSILGGSADLSGGISSDSTIKSVTILGDVTGGTGANTGFFGGKLGTVTIGGSIRGGTLSGAAANSGVVLALEGPSALTIGGSIVGGSVSDQQSRSGVVFSFGKLGSVHVHGSLLGGSGTGLVGVIYGFNGAGSVKIGGDMTTAPGASGFAGIGSGSDLGAVTIGGSLAGGSSIGAVGRLGAVAVGGEIRGSAGALVTITALGKESPATAAEAVALAGLTVKGDVRFADIRVGYAGGTAGSPSSSIGNVSVGGNWIASVLTASVDRGAGGVAGDGNDVQNPAADSTTLPSRIGNITIGGYVAGTPGGSDTYTFEAQQLGLLKIGKAAYNFTTSVNTLGLRLGATNDVVAQEIDSHTHALPTPTFDQILQLPNTNQPNIFHWTDVDGDLVTLQITGAKAGYVLNTSDLTFDFTAPTGGRRLQELHLDSSDPEALARATVSITAVPQGGFGDSSVNVGFINADYTVDGNGSTTAFGLDVGTIIVGGDLGRLMAGGEELSQGVKTLTVRSMGAFGLSTQAAGGSLVSYALGGLDTINIKTNLDGATLHSVGSGRPTAVTIGGDLRGSDLTAAGGIDGLSFGAVKIGGSLLGGATGGGFLGAGLAMKSLTVGGSIIGGKVASSGFVSVDTLGSLTVKGSLLGDVGSGSGWVEIRGAAALTSVAIGGSLRGGAAANTGDLNSGTIFTQGSLGAVAVGGSLEGGKASRSGSIHAQGKMGVVKILGSLIGGSGPGSGAVFADVGGFTSISIARDVQKGPGSATGVILQNGFTAHGSVTIGGSLIGGAVGSEGSLGVVKIGGDVRSAGAATAAIFAGNSIASLAIKGSVSHALFLAGTSSANGTIGAVTVGGNWMASSMAAAIDSGSDGFFGDTNDALVAGDQDPVGHPVYAKIASIVITGYAFGAIGAGNGDPHYGIEAEQIGSLKIGTARYPLVAGARSAADLTGYQIGTTAIATAGGNPGAFLIREV